ncbi:putative quinol monooxygenase [Parerythrobacter aurantius]|uniref:putative quinol monooxygenase n=1 Tax=Parerythrobacter aurantius TaxID=3127706 RepID=UPI003245A4F0
MSASIIVIGTIRLPPHKVDEARGAMRQMVEASRAEDGCLEYAYAEDVLEPGLVRVIERWRDCAALERHFAAPHLAEWRASWPDLEIGERKLVKYDAGTGMPA